MVRVISGEFRSRVLQSVPGTDVRPTPDRLRESLFNILAPDLEGAVFLDAYAGSGAVGIEALSRGAANAVFIENSKIALGVIEANLKVLGISGRASVLRGKVKKSLLRDWRILPSWDPPYPLEVEYKVALGILGQDARVRIVVAQHSVRFSLAQEYGHLEKYRELRQGENTLSFFHIRSTEAKRE